MIAITLHDLRFRARQFLIAVVGAGLVFSMALLLTGLANSFRAEVRRTVASVGADAWIVSNGSSGPFTAFGALPATTVDALASTPGVRAADPLVIVPETTTIDGEVHGLRLFGHRPGGMGAPEPSEGRAVRIDGEVVVDRRLGLDVGDGLDLVGRHLVVVGLVRGHTLLGGIPNVYATVSDAQRIAFQGQPLVTTVVVSGAPAAPPAGMTVLSSEAVRADTVHAMRDAIASIDNSRSLMWIVAAVIVAALMYVSALERLRDFAVLKSLGAPSWLLFVGVALQSIAVTLLAAVFALGASRVMRPMFALPTSVPVSAYVVLPIVAVVVGLVSSLVALRRAVSVDPASAFAGAM
ncbi:MAG TPA: ABC transporter permease [Acidimicrobiales bacterium]|nr:ABC transporter permease [Acidimicrobiales bacterium]